MPPDSLTPETDISRCFECSEPASPDFVTTNGDDICEFCADHHYRQCHECTDYVHRHEAIAASDDWRHSRPRYCEPCAAAVLYQCDNCEEYVTSLGEDGTNCGSCQPVCDGCDHYEHHCECGERLLNSYSYSPFPVFHGEGPAYLGLELEITARGDEPIRTAIDAIGSLGYLKEDGSVDGFELVTHPMSHAYARESFPWAMLEDLERQGCSGHNAGIHVHVSRDGFSGPSHIYRWMKLIYRNADAVRAIARRWSSDWAAFDGSHRRNHKHYAKGLKNARRYSAINVQNEKTFEMRVFASSLKREEVQAALDLVAASVEYTRDLTVPQILDGGWTWDGFMAWARDRPEYSALVSQSKELVEV